MFGLVVISLVLGYGVYQAVSNGMPKIPIMYRRDRVSDQLNPDYSLPVIYGEGKTSGNMIFYNTCGTDNKYLDIVVAVCEGEIEGFTKVYMDDGAVPLFAHEDGSVLGHAEFPFNPLFGKKSASGSLKISWPGGISSSRIDVDDVSFYGGTDYTIGSTNSVISALNASTNTKVSAATYSLNPSEPDTIDIVYDTPGASGNDVNISHYFSYDSQSEHYNSVNWCILSGGRDEYYARGYFFHGTGTQAADSVLTADYPPISGSDGWTANHKLKDIAYVHIRLTHNPDLFSGSIPRFTFEVKGRKVYDPRIGITAYSTNNALCLRDYLLNSTFGKGLELSTINESSFIAAANDCDTLKDGKDVTGSAIQYKIYEIGAVVDTSKQIKDNVIHFLQSMNATLPYIDGTYYLSILKAGNPIATFDENNIVGQVSLVSSGKRDRINKVTITFPDKAKHYEKGDAVLDPLTTDNTASCYSADAIAYYTADQQILEKRIEAPFVNYYPRARDIAELTMKMSRRGMSISFTTTLEILKTIPGDIIGLTYPTFGWTNREFRVERITSRLDGLCDVVASEHDDVLYTLTTQQEAPTPNVTSLKDPRDVAKPIITSCISDETTLLVSVEGLVQPRIYVTWSNSDPYPLEYYIYCKKSTDVAFTKVGQITKDDALAYYIGSLEWGAQYDVGVAVLNGAGFTSSIAISSVTVPNPLASAIYNYPDVSGLELVGQGTNQGQGNDTNFTGKDIRLQWRASSSNATFEFGSTASEQMGSVGGVVPFTLSGYRIEVFHPNDTDPRQEYTVSDTNFTYTLDKNIEDGNGTPSRTVSFKVYAVGQVAGLGVSGESEVAAKITVTNPQPTQLQGLSFSPGFQVVTIKFTKPTDADYKGVRVFMGTVSGFARNETTLAYDGPDTTIVLTGLESNKDYFFVLSPYDEFGTSGSVETSEYTVRTFATISSSEVAGLSTWATRTTPVDSTFITSNMANDAITSTQIAGIAAGKIQAGAIASVVNVAGTFVAVGGTTPETVFNKDFSSSNLWRVEVGPITSGGTTYVLRYHNGTITKLSVDEAGNAYFGGTLSVGSVEGVINSGTTITGGGITLSSGGSIKSAGMTNETPIVGGGVWLGYNGTKYTFGAGNETNYIKWDGTNVNVSGDLLIDANNYWKKSNNTLKIGNTTNYISWDGTNINLTGDILLDTYNYWKKSNNTLSIGNANNAITWDGTNLTVKTIKTSATGKRIELNPGGNNQLEFYGDIGNGTIEKLADIGISTSGVDYVVGKFGSTTTGNGRIGVVGYSNSSGGVYGESYSGVGVSGRSVTYYGVYGRSTYESGVFGVSTDYVGVYGVSTNNAGVHGSSTNNYGGFFGGPEATRKGCIRLEPRTTTTAPTHIADIGTFECDANGGVWVYTYMGWRAVAFV